MSAIIIEHLSLSYYHGRRETQALDDISMSVADGSIVGLKGPSGCGKSTLLHILSGILTHYKGLVTIDGEAPNPQKHSIALVPQSFALLPWKPVRENILLPHLLGKACPHEDRLDEITQRLGIKTLLDRYPCQLSGGQQQRVALARAFVQQPDLLLLDEPFSALDLDTVHKSRELFAQFQQEFRVTTILVSHNAEEITTLAERILVLQGEPGRIISDRSRPTAQEIREAICQQSIHER